jgi:hypothetical protein
MILTEHSPLKTVSDLQKPRFLIFDGVAYVSLSEAASRGL